MAKTIGYQREDMDDPNLHHRIHSDLYGASQVAPASSLPGLAGQGGTTQTVGSTPGNESYRHGSRIMQAGVIGAANGATMGIPSLVAPDDYARESDAQTGSPALNAAVKVGSNLVGGAVVGGAKALSSIGEMRVASAGIQSEVAAGGMPSEDVLNAVFGSSKPKGGFNF